MWGMLWKEMEERFWAVGVYATIAMSLLWVPLSIRPLRVKMYETFLIIHIAVSFAILVLLYYHVDQFGYTAWVWICAGIWVSTSNCEMLIAGI